MTAVVVAVCALLGVLAGPACNVLIDRVPEREPLRGAAPPWRPATTRQWVVEALTIGVFVALAARFGADWALPAYLVFGTAMVVVSVIDLERYLIPNRIVYPTLAASLPLLAVAATAQHRYDRLGHAGVGMAAAWGFLLIVHLISPRAMGFGDVRLAAILGLFLGWLGYGHVALGLFLGFLLGSIGGIVLVIARRRSRRDAIPFGPFLTAGALIAVLAGNGLLDWYNGT